MVPLENNLIVLVTFTLISLSPLYSMIEKPPQKAPPIIPLYQSPPGVTQGEDPDATL